MYVHTPEFEKCAGFYTESQIRGFEGKDSGRIPNWPFNSFFGVGLRVARDDDTRLDSEVSGGIRCRCGDAGCEVQVAAFIVVLRPFQPVRR